MKYKTNFDGSSAFARDRRDTRIPGIVNVIAIRAKPQNIAHNVSLRIVYHNENG